MLFRAVVLSMVVLVTQGCVSLHADVPEEAIRYHLNQEEGIDLPAVCSHDGKAFSEGATMCMTTRVMSCGPDGRWVHDGTC